MLIPEPLQKNYPAVVDRQCTHFSSTCRNCHNKFVAAEVICARCGAARERCSSVSMRGRNVCRSHHPRALYKVENLATAAVTEEAILEVMESADSTLEQELGIARVVLARIVSDGDYRDSEKLDAIDKVANIAAKKRRMECDSAAVAGTLGEKHAEAIRASFRMLLNTFKVALETYEPNIEIRRRVMDCVRAATHRNDPAGAVEAAGEESSVSVPETRIRKL